VTGSVPLRFAVVGIVNTLLDITLFMVLCGEIGTVAANLVSTSAGMTCSFVANGLFTFGVARLTVHDAVLFVATTGVLMWVLQPLVIHAVVGDSGQLLLAKVAAVGICLVLNFAACRLVVWPGRDRHEESLTGGD
jgi:putative flippase GtrA